MISLVNRDQQILPSSFIQKIQTLTCLRRQRPGRSGTESREHTLDTVGVGRQRDTGGTH